MKNNPLRIPSKTTPYSQQNSISKLHFPPPQNQVTKIQTPITSLPPKTKLEIKCNIHTCKLFSMCGGIDVQTNMRTSKTFKHISDNGVTNRLTN